MSAPTGDLYADLHVHTTRSDGSLEPTDVPAAAQRTGLSAVAITDHDVLAPFEGPSIRASDWVDGDEFESGRSDDVTIVAGIELRVQPAEGDAIDLLGYGLQRTDALAAETERIQTNRRERGRAIVECVEDRLGIDLDVSIESGFGRPHVARAIDEHPETHVDYEGAFAELIGDEGPCYVAREIPRFERGRSLLEEACDLVALAHPLRYRDPDVALELTAALDAVERPYTYGREVDLTPVDRAIERHDLLATGGSDAHDDRLGLAGIDRREYERLAPATW